MKRKHIVVTELQEKRLAAARKKLGNPPLTEMIRQAINDFLAKHGV